MASFAHSPWIAAQHNTGIGRADVIVPGCQLDGRPKANRYPMMREGQYARIYKYTSSI
jgi:hypothetical protein